MTIKLTLKQKIKIYIQLYTRIDIIKCLFGFHKYSNFFSNNDDSGVVCIICLKEIKNKTNKK